MHETHRCIVSIVVNRVMFCDGDRLCSQRRDGLVEDQEEKSQAWWWLMAALTGVVILVFFLVASGVAPILGGG